MQDIPGHVQQVEALMFTNMLASCRFLIACVCKVTCGCLVRGLPCLGVLAHEGGLPAERQCWPDGQGLQAGAHTE